MTRRLPILALLLALTAGCGVASGGEQDRLTIYSGRDEALVGPILERFAEETGIGVDVRYGDSAELALLLAEEGEDSPADVFYSQSPGATGYLAGEDLLAPLPEDLTGRVDQAYRDQEGRWVGVTGRQRVLVHNTELVDEAELPASVLDLAGEEWAGRVGVAPSNGSFQDFVTALRGAEGDEAAAAWLAGLAEGGAPTYANNNAIVEAVGRGEIEMGLVNHYYTYRFLAEDPDLPIANHLFADGDIGALVLPSPVSVLASSPRQEAAAELAAYLLADEAQRFFAEETKEYPLAAGLEPAADVPPLDAASAPAIDVDGLGGGLRRTVDLIEDSGLDG